MSHWFKPFFEPIMFELIVKLLAIICLPVATVIVWRIRTRSTWYCLAIAFGAITINYVARLPLKPVYSFYAIHWVGRPLVEALPWLISAGIIYGLLREGIRWLLMRFAVRTAWSWDEGVFFGICYSILAISLVLGNEIYTDITIRGLWHPSQIIPYLNDYFWSRKVLVQAWEWSLPLIALNVGTSLAVLLSVRRRQVWPFLIATLFYLLYMAPSYLAWPLKPVLEWAGVARWNSVDLAYFLLSFLAALPPLWFTLHLRRTAALAS